MKLINKTEINGEDYLILKDINNSIYGEVYNSKLEELTPNDLEDLGFKTLSNKKSNNTTLSGNVIVEGCYLLREKWEYENEELGFSTGYQSFYMFLFNGNEYLCKDSLLYYNSDVASCGEAILYKERNSSDSEHVTERRNSSVSYNKEPKVEITLNALIIERALLLTQGESYNVEDMSRKNYSILENIEVIQNKNNKIYFNEVITTRDFELLKEDGYVLITENDCLQYNTSGFFRGINQIVSALNVKKYLRDENNLAIIVK